MLSAVEYYWLFEYKLRSISFQVHYKQWFWFLLFGVLFDHSNRSDEEENSDESITEVMTIIFHFVFLHRTNHHLAIPSQIYHCDSLLYNMVLKITVMFCFVVFYFIVSYIWTMGGKTVNNLCVFSYSPNFYNFLCLGESTDEMKSFSYLKINTFQHISNIWYHCLQTLLFVKNKVWWELLITVIKCVVWIFTNAHRTSFTVWHFEAAIEPRSPKRQV